MAGEIPQQDVHVAGRVERRQQQVAIEQGIRRLQVPDVRRAQAAGVGDLVEYGLGDPLLVEQVVVVPGDLVTLLKHRGLQSTQAVHGLDLGRQDHLVVGFGQEIVAARFQATGQGFTLSQ
ncbi:hypothetical protein D3C76_1142020 [compost metagenome]